MQIGAEELKWASPDTPARLAVARLELTGVSNQVSAAPVSQQLSMHRDSFHDNCETIAIYMPFGDHGSTQSFCHENQSYLYCCMAVSEIQRQLPPAKCSILIRRVTAG